VVVAGVLGSTIEDQVGSDGTREVQAVVSTIGTVSGVAGEGVGLDQVGETDMGDRRRVVDREVMNVAITLVGRVVAQGLAIVQAREDHTTVQEALKAADSKLKNFFLSSISPISSN